MRYKSTNLTRAIAKAFSKATPEAEASLYNSGSIRLDDELSGTITQYDVIRTLPYGGKILIAEMRGSLLRKALETSARHPGNGGFLQYDRIAPDKKKGWTINGKPLDDRKVYRIAVNDFLVSGKEQILPFLNADNPELLRIHQPGNSDTARADLRQAMIYYLRQGGR